MTDIKIIKESISMAELKQLAREQFGDVVKAVVDIGQEVMAIGGELHSDMEVLLVENENSKREETWGINLHLNEAKDGFIEFDSMINLKPTHGNRTRNVENEVIRKKIREITSRIIR